MSFHEMDNITSDLKEHDRCIYREDVEVFRRICLFLGLSASVWSTALHWTTIVQKLLECFWRICKSCGFCCSIGFRFSRTVRAHHATIFQVPTAYVNAASVVYQWQSILDYEIKLVKNPKSFYKKRKVKPQDLKIMEI